MRSLQVQRLAKQLADAPRYSALMVCQSPAGYYLGTKCSDGSPGSRDSCYFHDKATAEFALQLCERMYRTFLAMRAKPAAETLGIDLSDEGFSRDFAAALYMCGLDPFEVGYRLEP